MENKPVIVASFPVEPETRHLMEESLGEVGHLVFLGIAKEPGNAGRPLRRQTS